VQWEGPTRAQNPVNPPKGILKIAMPIVTMTSADSLQTADGFIAGAKSLDWKTNLIDGQGTPQGFSNAFATALAEKPNAIADITIPDTYVGPYILQTKQKKIPTVVISQSTDPKASEHFDVDVPYPGNFQAVLQAYYVICQSNGTAQVAYTWDPGYPSLVSELAVSMAIMKMCTGCKVLTVHYHDTATAENPNEYATDTSALLQKYGNNLQYLLTPYGVDLQSAAEAVKTSGFDTKLLTLNGDPSSIALVHQGLVEADVATSNGWLGMAGFDQLLRVMAGQQPLSEGKEGLPERLITQSSYPPGGVVTWPVNYAHNYELVWGEK
jgi:ribose transport system substrate-binding protein